MVTKKATFKGNNLYYDTCKFAVRAAEEVAGVIDFDIRIKGGGLFMEYELLIEAETEKDLRLFRDALSSICTSGSFKWIEEAGSDKS